MRLPCIGKHAMTAPSRAAQAINTDIQFCPHFLFAQVAILTNKTPSRI